MTEFFAPLTDWLNGLTGMDVSIHGYLSILFGLIAALVLYVGLLYLFRLSHRNGHDDAVWDYRDPRNSEDS